MLQSGEVFSAVLVLLMIAVAFAQEEDCPNRASVCPSNCEGPQMCSRFLNAECRENPCYNLCTPNFFWKGRNVTNRCNVQRCADKVCPGKRQCKEEVFPASCTGNRTLCRQYIRARCELPPEPTDCSQITCDPGMFCRNKKRGEGVTCARIRNCNHLVCEEGLTCTETQEGPVCIEEQPSATPPSEVTINTPFPNFCELCERFGQVCEVVDGTYQCIDPTECIPLRVAYCLNTLGQLCEEINGTAQCVSAESCDDIECPPGTTCEDFGGILMTAFCNRLTTAEDCSQLDCESLGQVCEQRNDSAVCVTGCTAFDIELCEQQLGTCEVKDGFAQCVLPTNCDNVDCEPGSRCVVIEGANETDNLVICAEIPAQTCEEIVCSGAEGVCLQVYVPSRNFSSAQCSTPDIANILPTFDQFVCPGSPIPHCQPTDLCVNIYNNGQFQTIFCANYTTNCTDDSVCLENEVCTDVPEDLLSVVDFTTICLPMDESQFELGGSCDSITKQCSEGLSCLDTVLETIVGTTCGVATPVIGPSCTELECGGFLECVGYLVSDRGGLAQCNNEEGIDALLRSLGLFQ